MAILADNILSGVKRRCVLPSNQVLLQDADILVLADDIVKIKIIPLLESVNQEYFVTTQDVTIVANQSVYPIPYRAMGRALREIKLVDANGNVRNIAEINIEDAHSYSASANILGFYFIGDQIRLVPDVPSTLSIAMSIRFWYRLPPNSLCASTSSALITSVTATTVGVNVVPSNLVNGSIIDFIQGQSGNSIYAFDKTLTSISGSTFTFGAGVIPATAPNILQAGDYVSLAQTSPVLNFIPNEVSPYLETLISKRVLKAIGDFDGANILNDDIKEEKEDLLKLLEPRSDGEAIIIINRQSLVRGNKFAQRRWLYGS